MQPNPLLKKLGLCDDDRVVIFHADDIGMCQASLAAYRDLVDFGLLSAAATMVPCAWFPATAVYCRHNQASKPNIDMGVHLTLTSEWEGYRWRPISTHDPASGLIDEAGYFYADERDAQKHGLVTAVQREIDAQIERALAAGIDVTHIDSHMGTLFHPKFLPAYFQTARKYRLPALMLRKDAAHLHAAGLDEETAVFFAQQIRDLEAQGFPMLDHHEMTPLDEYENRLEHAKGVLDGLPAGITYFIIHPSPDTSELRAIAPDWRARVADYELFTNEAWREYVTSSNVHVIGYRDLRDWMRSAD